MNEPMTPERLEAMRRLAADGFSPATAQEAVAEIDRLIAAIARAERAEQADGLEESIEDAVDTLLRCGANRVARQLERAFAAYCTLPVTGETK